MESLSEKILAYLKSHNTLTMTTVIDNKPQAAPLFYVNIGLSLYFLSEPKTRHCTNLAANSFVAAAITEDYHYWKDIKGIQLEGQAAQVTGKIEKARAMAAYIEKFPFVSDFIKSAEFRKLMDKVKFYKITPETVWFVDNSQGFSHREQLDMTNSSPKPPNMEVD